MEQTMKKAGYLLLLFSVIFIAHALLKAEETITYNADIKPVISSKGCSGCHGFAGTYENLMAAVSSKTVNGVPIVNPAKPDSSVIIWRIEGKLPSGETISRMPPGGSLPEETITLFRTWIEQGANEDISTGVEKHTWSEIKRKYK